jgi:regulator of protease activity HflC (stomatin/prohibitin superfamily)
VREAGPDYFEVLVRPVVRSTVRRVLAEREFAELTTDGIRSAQSEVTRIARERLRPLHIVLDDVLLKGVVLVAPRAGTEILATAAREQEVLAIPSAFDIARARADAWRTQARAIGASHALVAPTLVAAVLADERARAWSRLLAATSSDVVVTTPFPSGRVSTIVEVKP